MVKIDSCAAGSKSLLRHEAANSNCSTVLIPNSLNPVSRPRDPMEACAHGAPMMGMKPF